MSTVPEPNEQERIAAKRPHDIFLSNLIGNHILVFTAIATFGPNYIQYMLLVPLFSFMALAYTFYRSSQVEREDSEFVWVHWRVARRWSQFFLIILLLLVTVSTLGWLGKTYLGMMQEAVYGMIGGLGLLPTLVSMPRLFVENAATGIYFRVIEIGSVAEGDSVKRITEHPEKLSVKQLFQAYFDKTIPVVEKRLILKRSLTIDALSVEWRQKLETRLVQS